MCSKNNLPVWAVGFYCSGFGLKGEFFPLLFFVATG
jgi:hypothetical protein